MQRLSFLHLLPNYFNTSWRNIEGFHQISFPTSWPSLLWLFTIMRGNILFFFYWTLFITSVMTCLLISFDQFFHFYVTLFHRDLKYRYVCVCFGNQGNGLFYICCHSFFSILSLVFELVYIKFYYAIISMSTWNIVM